MLQRSWLQHSQWLEVDLRDANMEDVDLTGARLEHCDLRGVQLSEAQMAQATLVDCVQGPAEAAPGP